MKNIFHFSIISAIAVLMISFNADAMNNNSGNPEILKTLENMQTKLDILVSDQTCNVVETKLDQHIADTDAKLEEILQAIGNGNGGDCEIIFEDARWVRLDCGIRDEVFDKDWGNTWEQHPTSLQMTWQEAVDYCPTLGDGWALPEIHVLESIVDTSNTDPALPTGHPFDNVQGAYWSNTISSATQLPWLMFIKDGIRDDVNFPTNPWNVWCVRGGP